MDWLINTLSSLRTLHDWVDGHPPRSNPLETQARIRRAVAATERALGSGTRGGGTPGGGLRKEVREIQAPGGGEPSEIRAPSASASNPSEFREMHEVQAPSAGEPNEMHEMHEVQAPRTSTSAGEPSKIREMHEVRAPRTSAGNPSEVREIQAPRTNTHTARTTPAAPKETHDIHKTKPNPGAPAPLAFTATPRGRPEIPPGLIDPQASQAVRRLLSQGYPSYLVGGCVRDLLLGITPKDFDIATSARPEEVKRLFRNSRIIGRRFRLVHLYYRAGKVLEVATFRAIREADDDDEDVLIRRDNVFGTEEEDARRRDFTINGLFYDLKSGQIIDHVGGMKDIRQRRLRMIGDPDLRLREDPVRILRAVRFASKIEGLKIDPELLAAMRRHKEEVLRCAPARVLEETLRLLRIGCSETTVNWLDELGMLKLLLPDLADFLSGQVPGSDIQLSMEETEAGAKRLYRFLAALDRRVKDDGLPDELVLGAVLYPVLERYLAHQDDPSTSAFIEGVTAFLNDVASRVTLTRRVADQLRQVYILQRSLVPEEDTRRRKSRPERVMDRRGFADALALFELRAEATGEHAELVKTWQDRWEHYLDGGDDFDEDRPDRPKKRRRRSKKKSRAPKGASKA